MNQTNYTFAVGDATNHADDGHKIPVGIYILIIVLAMIFLCSCCLVCFAKIFYGSVRNFWHDLRHGRRDGEVEVQIEGDAPIQSLLRFG